MPRRYHGETVNVPTNLPSLVGKGPTEEKYVSMLSPSNTLRNDKEWSHILPKWNRSDSASDDMVARKNTLSTLVEQPTSNVKDNTTSEEGKHRIVWPPSLHLRLPRFHAKKRNSGTRESRLPIIPDVPPPIIHDAGWPLSPIGSISSDENDDGHPEPIKHAECNNKTWASFDVYSNDTCFQNDESNFLSWLSLFATEDMITSTQESLKRRNRNSEYLSWNDKPAEDDSASDYQTWANTYEENTSPTQTLNERIVSDGSSETSGGVLSMTSSDSTVVDPSSQRPLIRFASIQPRSVPLKRRSSSRRDRKALKLWRKETERAVQLDPPVSQHAGSDEKRLRWSQTREFIMREFYSTEVTFLTQMFYVKMVFFLPIVGSAERPSPLAMPGSRDVFANLPDLLSFSSRLVQRIHSFLPCKVNKDSKVDPSLRVVVCPSQVRIGQALCEMAEDLVVFLRCATDYGNNRKHYDRCSNTKICKDFRQKLMQNKNLRQFSLLDYLICPIQRVARYRLLIQDLLRHTEPDHPDYRDLVNSHVIVSGLASAMDIIQE